MLSTFDDAYLDRASIERACECLYVSHRRRLVQYARLRGCDDDDAEDVVQELFLRLIRLGLLVRLSAESDATQTAHLTRTLRCMIMNQWRNSMRMRRGGGCAPLSLHDMMEDGQEVPCASNPSVDHDHAWAVNLLERGLELLRRRMGPVRWRSIEPSLMDEAPSDGFRPAEVAQRVAAHRARIELRRFLTRETGFGSDTKRASLALFHAMGRYAS